MSEENNIENEVASTTQSADAEAQSSPAGLAERFMYRFAGLDRAYGRYTLAITEPAGTKKVGGAATIQGLLTVDLWRKHLRGEQGLGVVPIRDDGTCTWGCIDVDIYDLDINELERIVRGTPLVVCRSKSGGAHALLVFSEPVPAGKLIEKLKMSVAALGLPNTIEIFPKQAELVADRGDTGNWLIMPYFGGDRSTRYCVKDGGSIAPEEFLTFAADKALSLEQLEALNLRPGSLALGIPSALQLTGTTNRNADVSQIARPIRDRFPEFPPCMQLLMSIGVYDNRNTFLFNVSLACEKAYPDNWKAQVHEINRDFCHPPLTDKELEATVFKRDRRKKNYQYTCSNPPIVGHCNSRVCQTRQFGVPASNPEMPAVTNFRGIRDLGGRSTYYFEIEGKPVGPLTAEDLCSEHRLAVRVMNDAFTTLPSLGPKKFKAWIAGLLRGCQVEDLPPEATEEGIIWQYLVHFCQGRAQCEDPWDVPSSKKPYTDHETGVTTFKLEAFKEYLARVRCFIKSVPAILRQLGVRDVNIDWPINEKAVKKTRLWQVELEPKGDTTLPVPKFGTSWDEIEKQGPGHLNGTKANQGRTVPRGSNTDDDIPYED
jgi:TOTE conflict system, Archaeo-Eukaryotic Primase domain